MKFLKSFVKKSMVIFCGLLAMNVSGNVVGSKSDSMTGLTKDNAALVLIDHQVNLINSVKTQSKHDLMSSLMALAQVGKLFKLPVILTTNGSAGSNGKLAPELVNLFPDNKVLDRTLINSWDDPAFVSLIEKTHRKKLIMAAISTEVCLAFAAISASQAGYEVYAVMDASGTSSLLVEQAAMLRMLQAGVILTTWQAIATELQSDWARKETAQGLYAIFKQAKM